MTVPASNAPERSAAARGAAPHTSGHLHRPEIPAASLTLAKEIVLVALGALRANKMRSFLTMLGIVIGVAAVIAMVAIGKGAQNSISERIAGLGTTLLTVRPGSRRGFGVATEDAQKLTVEDAEALERRGKYFAAVGPEMSKRLLLQYGTDSGYRSKAAVSRDTQVRARRRPLLQRSRGKGNAPRRSSRIICHHQSRIANS
jgi:ABC-type lipoprotein release transport system permease subunit